MQWKALSSVPEEGGAGRRRTLPASFTLRLISMLLIAWNSVPHGEVEDAKKKGMQIVAERSVNLFRQHARRRTTQTAPESGHQSRDGQLRCHGWGVVTWKFTEPVYESGGLWCNCEACCVLRACPFWCQRSKYLSSEFMACVHFSSRAFITGKFQPRRVRAPTRGWNKSAIQILSKINLHKVMFCISTIMVMHKHW